MINRAEKDLETSKYVSKTDEGISYTIAYLAMLHAGRALMLSSGFRPAGEHQHKTVVEFTGACLGKEYEVAVRIFDVMRKKRNIFTYEIDISISNTEVKTAIENAGKFIVIIKKAIKEQNPQKTFEF